MEQIVGNFLETLRRTQFLPRDRLATYQRAQLEGLVRHARTHVPFYRESGRLDPLFAAMTPSTGNGGQRFPR